MDKPRHPKGLPILFFTEMWERFSFYLMLGILFQYLSDSEKGGLGMTDTEASVIFGSYLALVYFTPFIGGLIADRLLGCRKTIVIGAVLMMLGEFALVWPTETGLFLGLTLLILGNGAFKPNISTLLGNLYPPGSPLKDAGYNIFYMGINIGAFICNFVAALVRNYYDQHPLQVTSTWTVTGWNAAFATAGIGMFLGLITFLTFYKMFAEADPKPKRGGDQESLMPLWLECLLPAAVLGALGWVLCDATVIKWFSVDVLGKEGPLYKPPVNAPTAAFLVACVPVIIFYIRIWRKVPDQADRNRVGALLVIFAVVILFWAVFHLNGTALTAWTRDNTDRVPGKLVEKVTALMPEFAEDAPAKYYHNADKETPRPAQSTFKVVSEKEYKALEDAKKLNVQDGEPLVVTQKMLDEIEKKADSSTPQLEPNKHLKLVNTELYQSINPFFVVLFTPLVVGFFHWLRSRGMEPSTSAKIGLGLLLTAGGPLVMWAATVHSNDGETKASVAWLFGVYAVVTFGELCLSPMGLSLVNKMSPANIRAFMMGGWFLSTSFGNKLSGIFGEVYTEPTTNHFIFWPVLACSLAGSAAIIFVLLPWLNRQMGDQK
jgi:POT family proton-dependent oligopeptide transporter